MEIETRPTPSALDAISRIAATPFGVVLFQAIGQLMVAHRNADVESEEPQPEQPESVLKRIEETPHDFDLFSALRLLECAYQEMPRLGEAKRPRDEPIRIGQKISFAFPTADIDSIEPANEFHPIRLQQNVLGLFGPNGALPLHLTEFAYERKLHEGDETFARFVDIFHHRMLLMFYRSWSNSQPVICLDRPNQDRFGCYIAAICGLGMPTLRDRDSVDDKFKLSQAGIFGRLVKNAEGLQILLINYFSVKVHIDQWVGYWMPIPTSERMKLGVRKGFSILGQDAVIGDRIWDCQTKFRIILGPLSMDDYSRFLPSGSSFSKLVDIVKLYIGIELDWELQLLLQRDKVPPMQLGSEIYLGWTTWLGEMKEKHEVRGLKISSSNVSLI